MRPLLLFSALALGACSSMQDTPPDPSLANVQVVELRIPADKIAETARQVGGVQQIASGQWKALAYSQLIRGPGSAVCIVVLPIEGEAAFVAKLRQHEEKHCHGEDHPGRARFRDEFAFASEGQR